MCGFGCVWCVCVRGCEYCYILPNPEVNFFYQLSRSMFSIYLFYLLTG